MELNGTTEGFSIKLGYIHLNWPCMQYFRSLYEGDTVNYVSLSDVDGIELLSSDQV